MCFSSAWCSSAGHRVFDVRLQWSTRQFRSVVPECQKKRKTKQTTKQKKKEKKTLENNPDCKYVQSGGCQRGKKKKKKRPKCFALLSASHSRSLSWDVMSSGCDGEPASRLESSVAFQVADLLFRVAMRTSESAGPGVLAPESTLAC